MLLGRSSLTMITSSSMRKMMLTTPMMNTAAASASGSASASFSTRAFTKDPNRTIVVATKRNLPQSAFKVSFLCDLIRGAWLPDALAQLKFSPKHRAEDVAKIVQRAASLAKMYHDAVPEDLFVREALVTKGASRKRLRIMGRGRAGVGYQRWCHVVLKVEKMDYNKEVEKAQNPWLKKKWQRLQRISQKVRSQQTEQAAKLVKYSSFSCAPHTSKI